MINEIPFPCERNERTSLSLVLIGLYLYHRVFRHYIKTAILQQSSVVSQAADNQYNMFSKVTNTFKIDK